MSKAEGTEKEQRAETGRFCEVQGPLWGPMVLFLGGEGAGRQTKHSKTRVPKPGMESEELPRRKRGQKLMSEPQSRVSKTRPSSNEDQ